jgi:hypothetical protein
LSSLAIKRIIAGAIGLLFAVVYGFWTMLITGGGHGNFVWFMMFMTVEYFGLYFPVMSVMAVDLRSKLTKIVFGSLIGFNLFASSILLLCWVIGIPVGKAVEMNDFSEMLRINGIGWILVCAAAHFLPTIIFLVLLVKALFFGSSLSDENDSVSLNLS